MHWVICAPAASRRNDSRFSGSLSGIEPKFPVAVDDMLVHYTSINLIAKKMVASMQPIEGSHLQIFQTHLVKVTEFRGRKSVPRIIPKNYHAGTSQVLAIFSNWYPYKNSTRCILTCDGAVLSFCEINPHILSTAWLTSSRQTRQRQSFNEITRSFRACPRGTYRPGRKSAP